MSDKVEEQVKQETTENDILDIDTSNDVSYGTSKDYRHTRPARGARVSKSIVGASKGETTSLR